MKKTISIGKKYYKAMDKNDRFKGFVSATSKNQLKYRIKKAISQGYKPIGNDLIDNIDFTIEFFIRIQEIDLNDDDK